MPAEQIDAYVHGHFSDEVSRATLVEMLRLVTGGRVGLLGFSDYAKHVVNLFPGTVVAIFDVDPRFVGFEFRGVRVHEAAALAGSAGALDQLLVCRFEDIVRFHDLVAAGPLAGTRIDWPEDFDGRPGHRYALEAQSERYRHLDRPDRLGEPPTMMPRETITLMTELLAAALRVAGDVAEIGVWQGGSGWNMARLMAARGDARPLHLLDLFDDHDRTDPEAIMCLDEIRARFAFYPETRFHRGPAAQHMPALADRGFAFVHIGLGFQPDIVDFFWRRLALGGIMLLDNYGHVRASPGLFDRYFADRGYSIVRSPFSYQAFIVK